MTNQFVSLPLDKLMNRGNIVSRVERLESEGGAHPSARVGRLSEFTPDAGDITAGRFLVFDNDTGQLQVAIDEDGVAITTPSSYAALNSIKWMDGNTIDSDFYTVKTATNLDIVLTTSKSTSRDSGVTIIANAPLGNVSEIALAAQINDTPQHYINIHSTNGVSISSIANDTGLAAGTWTPTATAGTNISASTDIILGKCNYLRVGNQVHINGVVQVDTTAIGAAVFYLSLPIASNFTASGDASGTAIAAASTPDSGGSLREDTTNDRLQFDIYSQVSTNLFWRFSGGYIVK